VGRTGFLNIAAAGVPGLEIFRAKIGTVNLPDSEKSPIVCYRKLSTGYSGCVMKGEYLSD
jgi:hypothetical protein